MLNREEIKNLPQLLTPHELAEAMGISLPFCYKLIRTKGFPSFRVGKQWVSRCRSATSSYAQRVFRAFVSVKSGSSQLTS